MKRSSRSRKGIAAPKATRSEAPPPMRRRTGELVDDLRRSGRGGRRIQDHVRQPVQPDDLDEPLDLRLRAADAHVAAGLPQPTCHHGEITINDGSAKTSSWRSTSTVPPARS